VSLRSPLTSSGEKNAIVVVEAQARTTRRQLT
jgi:hypothetical protein